MPSAPVSLTQPIHITLQSTTHDIRSTVHESIIRYFVNEYPLCSSSKDAQFLDNTIRDAARSRLGSRADVWLHSNLKLVKVMMKNQLITLTKEFKNAAYYITQQRYDLNPPITQ